MGCTSSNENQHQQQILPLAPDIINAYIDRVSIVLINKIKDKFESQLRDDYKQLHSVQFIKMFSNCPINDNRKKNLFQYFNNNSQHKLLKLNKFIQKYCILIKSDPQHFSQIIHRIFCKAVNNDQMSQEDFNEFEQQCHIFIKKDIFVSSDKFPLLWSHFFAHIENLIDWEGFQKSFHIVSIDELPYRAFHQELEKFSTLQYQLNEKYFIVSADWFSQWIFFYQYQDTDIKNSTYRSRGSQRGLKKKNSIQKRRFSKSKMNNSKMYSNDAAQNFQSLQPPTEINMNQIQGQYFGQLKPFLFSERDITIINEKMWTILKNTLGCDLQFKRYAIDGQNIDLYPISIYLYQTDSKGFIEHEKYQILRVKRKTMLTQLQGLIQKNQKQKAKRYKFYYKNFTQINFTYWSQQKEYLQQIVGQNPRIIIIQCQEQQEQKFKENYNRQNLTKQNATIGDKILAYFSYQDKFIESYILNSNKYKKQFKVHFIDYGYRYQRWIKDSDIKLIEQESNVKQVSKYHQSKKQSVFEGIKNIGNTCFINSTLQCLASTSIFDKFFLKANLSQKKYPLSFVLSTIIKGLLNKQKYNISNFKQIVNNKLPMFSGYLQHDAQQFLNLLIDKLDEQLIEKPNIIDELFSGVMESKFTCLKCNQVKFKEQKIHSISLPIPQSQYNYFTIMVFPIYSKHVRKIVLRLHKNAKMAEYLGQVQRRTNISRSQMVYLEFEYSVQRRFRNQLAFGANQDRKVTDLGISSNVQIWMYQKLKLTSFQYRLKQKRLRHQSQKITEAGFYDFFLNQEAVWVISKVMEISEHKVRLQCLKDYVIKEYQFNKTPQIQNQFNQLGSKIIEKTYRKIYMRKFNQDSRKMVFFDFQMLITLPKWISYNDAVALIDQYMQQLRKTTNQKNNSRNNSKISKHNSKVGSYDDLEVEQGLNQEQLKLTNLTSFIQSDRPYIIHFLEPQTNFCFFCQKQLQPFHNLRQIKNCCEPQNKDIPMYWVAKQKFYYFFIDWVQIDEYNEGYCNDIQIDNFSIAAEHKMANQRITLQKCLDLWKQPQNIEMQCEKCKFNEHLLQTSIKKAPIITIFHLKEFRYTEDGNFVKLNVNLEWTQSINLEKYCTTNKTSLYQMYSVVQHKGSANSGHYTTLSKRRHPLQRTKVWVNFDDEYTQILNQKPTTIENAYLLFFKKVDIPSSAIVHFSI